MSTASEPSAPAYRVLPYGEVAAAEALRPQIEEILLVSANPRRVADAPSRAAFLARWLVPYTMSYPEHLLLALAEAGQDGMVLGVLSGCPDSAEATVFRDLHPYYRLFSDLYADYPAHFHINCHPAHRGRGVGSHLARAFLARCRTAGLPGVHLVTAPGARNVGFYRRNGFTDAVERAEEARAYLFLGQRLAQA